MLAQIHSVLRRAEQTHDRDREASISYSVCSITSEICRSTSACSRQQKNNLLIDPHVKDHIVICWILKFSAGGGGGSPQVDVCRPTSVRVCCCKTFFPFFSWCLESLLNHQRLQLTCRAQARRLQRELLISVFTTCYVGRVLKTVSHVWALKFK